MYKTLIRPILFRFNPEKIHHATFSLIKFIHLIPGVGWMIKKRFAVNNPTLERKVFGIKFPNPVGLAAGFDKDAKLYEELSSFGFGFIEVGTVTPKPQEGNPKPRLFRLPEDQALINRMGFNNEGLTSMIERLKNRNPNLIIGGNIGKNKVTENERAHEDYTTCFDQLHPYVDYFVVNVSSPNTPNLRALQEKAPLLDLLNRLQERNKKLTQSKPILLKIAPDLTEGQLDDIIDIVQTSGIAGVIATNTTIVRDGLKTSNETIEKIGAGGLSGKPMTARATEVIRYLHTESNGAFPIIGVGGIYSAQDALDKLEAGASLVQVYTGFIYEGPGLIKKIKEALVG